MNIPKKTAMSSAPVSVGRASPARPWLRFALCELNLRPYNGSARYGERAPQIQEIAGVIMIIRIACVVVIGVMLSSSARGGEAISLPVKSRKATKKQGYSPAQATGEPELQAAGDNSHAWTPQPADGGVEWLKVEFDEAVVIAEVRIRESNNAGFVTKVVAYVDDGKEVVIFEGDDPSEDGLSDLVVEPTKKGRQRS